MFSQFKKIQEDQHKLRMDVNMNNVEINKSQQYPELLDESIQA